MFLDTHLNLLAKAMWDREMPKNFSIASYSYHAATVWFFGIPEEDAYSIDIIEMTLAVLDVTSLNTYNRKAKQIRGVVRLKKPRLKSCRQ